MSETSKESKVCKYKEVKTFMALGDPKAKPSQKNSSIKTIGGTQFQPPKTKILFSSL